MADAPERLWVQPENRTPIDEDPRHAGPHDVEYVRADLYAQVKRERDEWNESAQHQGVMIENLTDQLAAERLAGARVVITPEMVNAAWNKGKDLRMSGLPSDFRSVLEASLAEPAGEFDKILSDSSEFVASLSDSMRATGRSVFNPPESAGEVEPVAWRYRYNGKWYVCDSEAIARNGWDVTPLYTTPPDASAMREALERGHALANQVRAVTCHLNGQAYSSTVSALNYFDAALSRAALAGAKP